MYQNIWPNAVASGPNVGANLLEAERLIGMAVDKGDRLVVLPENFAFIGRSCSDTNALREESCTFPGLGSFYRPAVDQPPPQEPPPLGEKPAEPELPLATSAS